MQWLFDIILDMVANAGYALKTWVQAQGYALESWVLAQLCTSTCRIYNSPSQSIPTNTWTKLLFNTELWDVNSEFADYEFTAKQAGYFQVNLAVRGSSLTGGKRWNAGIYKNGIPHSVAHEYNGWAGYNGSYISDIIYLNGTTDSVEGRVRHNEGSAKTVLSNPVYSFLSVHQLSKDSCL